MLEFRLLGPFEVVSDGVPLRVGGPQQRAVLAALVLRANQVVSTTALVDVLWGDRTPSSAIGVVRTYTSRLRRALSAGHEGGARLVGRRPGYLLEVDRGLVDAFLFEELVGEAQQARGTGRTDAAAALLERALGLWRGEALADLADVEAFQPAVARLDQMRVTTLEDYIDAKLALGHHASVVVELEALTEEHPFRERLWGQFIVALYRSGRQADALAAYQTVRARLIDELGLEPGPELQALERQVLGQADELRWPTTRQGTRVPATGARLHRNDEPFVPGGATWPVHLTRFLGREAEVAELCRLATQARLVTLVGAPGCGKTRLATEVGALLASELAGGVRFIDLAPVTDPRSVANTVGLTFGVHEEAGRPMDETLIEALQSAEPALILLDNCEHVIDAVAEFAHQLILTCPSLRILATSRAALRLPGESVWHLQPLGRQVAVELFCDRARLASNRFQSVGASDEQVAAICHRLDGLPLAIELAAASTRALSLSQIEERLASALPLLIGNSRGRSSRHQTMVATVDWSHRLLPADARRMFTQLSVFAGAFDLDAVAAVVTTEDEELLTGLTTLIDHSLLLVDSTADGPARYRMLEPVRQCAEALLTANGDTEPRRRHTEHYLALARRFDPWGHRQAGPVLPIRRLEQEDSNLQAALGWTASHATHLFAELCEALAPFWELGSRANTGRKWMERALATNIANPRLRVNVQAWAGRLAWRRGDYETARGLLDDCLAVVSQLDDPVGQSLTRRLLAFVAVSEGDTETALRHCHASIALSRAANDTMGMIWSSYVLGWTHYAQGDTHLGDEQMRAALAANHVVGNATAAAHVLLGLQYGAFLAGDTTAQRAHLVGALTAVKAGGLLDMTDWLWSSAVLAAAEGRFDAAVRLVAGAGAMRRRQGSQYPQQLAVRVMEAFEPISANINEERRNELTTAGEHMDWDELLDEALAPIHQ